MVPITSKVEPRSSHDSFEQDGSSIFLFPGPSMLTDLSFYDLLASSKFSVSLSFVTDSGICGMGNSSRRPSL